MSTSGSVIGVDISKTQLRALAKIDRLDAQVLAPFGADMQPRYGQSTAECSLA